QMLHMTRRLWPFLRRAEMYIKPRYWPVPAQMTDRLIGLFTFVMAMAVTLPIPFGNWFPALAIALAGLALSQRDGILLALAIGVGGFAMFLFGLLIGAAGTAARYFWSLL